MRTAHSALVISWPNGARLEQPISDFADASKWWGLFRQHRLISDDAVLSVETVS